MEKKEIKIDNMVGISLVEGESYINLCAHPIRIRVDDKVINIPVSGVAAKVDRMQDELIWHSKIQVKKQIYGEIIGLPEPKKGVMFIVPSIVLNALNNTRSDVVCPGRTIRDANGVISYTPYLSKRD